MTMVMTDMAFFSVGGGALLLALRCAHLGRHHHQDCQDSNCHLFVCSVTLWFLMPVAVFLKLVINHQILVCRAVLAFLGKLPGQLNCQHNHHHHSYRHHFNYYDHTWQVWWMGQSGKLGLECLCRSPLGLSGILEPKWWWLSWQRWWQLNDDCHGDIV